MMQRQLAWLCSLLVLWPATGVPAAPNDASGPSAKVKERLAEAAPGSIVEVVLNNRERLRGRLAGQVESGIEIQHCKNRALALQAVPLSGIRTLQVHKNGILIPAQGPLQPWAVLEQATLIPQGKAVVIRHRSKGRLAGQLGALQAEEFELRSDGDAGVTSLRYDDVRSIEMARKPGGIGGKLLVIGAVTAAVFAVIVALAAAGAIPDR